MPFSTLANHEYRGTTRRALITPSLDQSCSHIHSCIGECLGQRWLRHHLRRHTLSSLADRSSSRERTGRRTRKSKFLPLIFLVQECKACSGLTLCLLDYLLFVVSQEEEESEILVLTRR